MVIIKATPIGIWRQYSKEPLILDCMEIAAFIEKLEESFDDIDPGTLKPETNYRDTDMWSSMHALIVIAMADTEYDVTITGDDLRSCNTVQELYELIKSRI